MTDVCGVAFRPFVRVEIRFFDRLVSSSSSSSYPFSLLFLTNGFCNVDKYYWVFTDVLYTSVFFITSIFN